MSPYFATGGILAEFSGTTRKRFFFIAYISFTHKDFYTGELRTTIILLPSFGRQLFLGELRTTTEDPSLSLFLSLSLYLSLLLSLSLSLSLSPSLPSLSLW